MLILKSVEVPWYSVPYCPEVTCQVLACWPMCRCPCLCFLLKAFILWLKRILACALCCCSSYWVCSDSCTQQLWSSGSQTQRKGFISPKPQLSMWSQRENGVRGGDENRTGFYCETGKSVVAWALYNLGKALAGILKRVMGEHGEISLRFFGASGWLYNLFRWS